MSFPPAERVSHPGCEPSASLGGLISEETAKLGEGLVLRHGEWRLARRGHVLWMGNSRAQRFIEWNCVGWGAALVRAGRRTFSVYCDGRVSPVGFTLAEESPYEKEEPAGDCQLLNVALQRVGEELRLTNELSGVLFSLSSRSNRVVYESPLNQNLSACSLFEDILPPRESLAPDDVLESPSAQEETSPELPAEAAEVSPTPPSDLAEQSPKNLPEVAEQLEELCVYSSLKGEVRFTVPFSIEDKQREALEKIAKYGRATLTELRGTLGRRVGTILSTLEEELFKHGLPLIKEDPESIEKTYVFQYEVLE